MGGPNRRRPRSDIVRLSTEQGYDIETITRAEEPQRKVRAVVSVRAADLDSRLGQEEEAACGVGEPDDFACPWPGVAHESGRDFPQRLALGPARRLWRNTAGTLVRSIVGVVIAWRDRGRAYPSRCRSSGPYFYGAGAGSRGRRAFRRSGNADFPVLPNEATCAMFGIGGVIAEIPADEPGRGGIRVTDRSERGAAPLSVPARWAGAAPSSRRGGGIGWGGFERPSVRH